MIEVRQATRKYGTKVAVDNVDLHVEAGEVFAFLGHNGAGKTTLIKMMVGLLEPTAGTIRLCGHDVTRQHRQASRHVGYVPDEPYLYDKLTGRETLQFVASMYGMSAGEAEACIKEQIEMFGLASFVDQLTENYSHGMKQRVVFASALVHRPDVLIVDEPMVGLDPRSMRLVKDLLRTKAQQGCAVFMSTHTLPVAEEIADRIGVIEQGNVRFLGTLAELRSCTNSEETSLEQLYLQLTSENDEDKNGSSSHHTAESNAMRKDIEAMPQ